MNNKGFTLIEVLIASVILFSALALTAELYSSSSLSAKKITQRALIAQVSPLAVLSIKSQLINLAKNRNLSEFSGEINILNVKFNWQAKRIKFTSRIMNLNDIVPPKPQFGLFNVIVFTEYRSTKSSEFTFKAATW